MQIRKSRPNINSEQITFTMLFLILFSTFTNAFPLATVLAESNQLLTPENIEIITYSGDIKTIEFDIENIGASNIYWNLTYSSNLGLDDDTVGLWHFNEGSGTEIVDETPNQNNGIASGALWTNGLFGTALRFDGIDDYVLVNNSLSLNVESLTLETWVKFHSISDMVPIGGVKDRGYGLYYRNNEIITPHVWAQGLKWYDTYIELSTEKWYYFAMTFDSSTGVLTWYLNGVKMDSRNEGADSMSTTSSTLIFGRGWTEKMFNLFNGIIDEIRISNVVRSEEEISNNHQRGQYGRYEWLSYTRNSGIIEPGDTDKINLVINTSNLAPGLYTRELTMLSSDPDSTNQKISVNLEVLPVSNDVSISLLDVIEQKEMDGLVNIRALVSNLGTNSQTDLNVSLIINGETEQTTIIGTLLPQSDTMVTYNWAPKISGFFNVEVNVFPVQGEVQIENNVITTVILIQGPPKIAVSSDVLSFMGDPGAYLEKTLMIRNAGFGNLTYIITDNVSNYVFIDNMEKVGGWTHTGEQDTWEFGEPTEGPDSSFSGKNSWGTDLDGNYQDESDSSLISPVINLSNRVQPELQFTHWYSFDPFGDYGYVELWDGVVWHTLNPEGFTGYTGGWTQSTLSLSEYTGMDVNIRFRLQSDDQIRDKGWFIDSVYVIDNNGLDGDWLTESPESGTIYPHESNEITAVVYAPELSPGRYFNSIVIHTNDPDNGTLVIPVELIVTGDDVIPPSANAGLDIMMAEDQEVQFDGSKSSDNFEITEYEWVFTDAITTTLKGIQPQHLFETPGTYQVVLTVIDSSGNTDSDNLVITITDVTKPNAQAGKDLSLWVRNAIQLDGSDSTDNTEITSYEWDLDDGSTKNGVTITHTYNTAGTYNVTLTVKDPKGNMDVDYLLVEILPPEGSGTYVFLIFITFILAIIIIFQYFFIKSRMRKRARARSKDIYRM